MLNSFKFKNMPSPENKGTVLEYEYLGEVSKRAYSQAVDKYKNPELYQVETMEDVERVFSLQNTDTKDYADSYKDGSYINFKDAIKIIEQCQPGKPESPQAFFAGALRKEVSNLLGSDYEVKFFTAVGSHLDTKHGIDAFIKIYNKEGEELSQVTIDVASYVKETFKADSLITITKEEHDLYDFDSESFNKDEFFRRIKAEALKIKNIIEKKINNQKIPRHEEVIGSYQANGVVKRKRPRIAR